MEFRLKEFGIVFVVLYFIYFLIQFVVYCKNESEREKIWKKQTL